MLGFLTWHERKQNNEDYLLSFKQDTDYREKAALPILTEEGAITFKATKDLANSTDTSRCRRRKQQVIKRQTALTQPAKTILSHPTGVQAKCEYSQQANRQ